MLKRDILTINIDVLFQKIRRIADKNLDDPDETLEEIKSLENPEMTSKLLTKSVDITESNDQLVKAQVDLFYHKSLIINNKNTEEGKILLQQAREMMDNYLQLFPQNFPFDFIQKKAVINSILDK